jgi:hypothetical protein
MFMAKKEFLEFRFFDIQFDAFAIHTALNLQVFAWNVDKILGSAFTLNDPFKTEIKKELSFHRNYIYRLNDTPGIWWLLENKGTQSLYQGKPIADFILIIDSSGEETDVSDIAGQIKIIPGVSIVYPIEGEEKKKLGWIGDLFHEELKREMKNRIKNSDDVQGPVQ